jgi:hypothetical protein
MLGTGEVMASLNKPNSLSQIIDHIEQMREELLTIQRALEHIEPAEDSAHSDGNGGSRSTTENSAIALIYRGAE